MNDSIADKIVRDLWNSNRNFCSKDYDKCLEYINEIIPLKIYHYPENGNYKGWVIPPKWDLVKGEIVCRGEVIFRATQPLHIIGLSKNFCGEVSQNELKKHLHYDSRRSDAIPYHFRQNYRPWDREWGFCVTKNFYDSLDADSYNVELITEESSGYLNVAEHTHQGENRETFVFVAHLDHGGMANDDLAGVAVGVEVFKHLLSKKTKFSYRLLLVQEIIGSVYYLGKNPEASEPVLESCFLEMLGSDTPLGLQHTFKGEGYLEKVLSAILAKKNDAREGPFRSIICNDEMVWESFNIPMASLSRFPYPEYHSNFDNPNIIKKEALSESVDIILELIDRLDKSILMRKKFQGVLALSNPDYNLYVDSGQMAFGNVVPDELKSLRLLMDLLPILPKEIFVEQIAEKVNLSSDKILDYLRKWQEKDLIQMI